MFWYYGEIEVFMKVCRKKANGVVQAVILCTFLNLFLLLALSINTTLPATGQNNPKHPKLKAFFSKAKETVQSFRNYQPTWDSYYKRGLKALQEKRYEAARNDLEVALGLAEKMPDGAAKVATTKQVLAICLREDLLFIRSKIPFVPPLKGDVLLGMTIFLGILGFCGYNYFKDANTPTDPYWLPILAAFLIVLGVGSTTLYGPLTEIERLEARLAELK
jgi:hypothetical protein